MSILSVQSTVVYGHVGNAAAVFCLRRLGHNVWPIDTVSFSNHPGHGGFRGRVRAADELAALIDGLAGLGVLGRCRAVLSGYLGAAGNGAVVLDALARAQSAGAAPVYCCDPVMGDREPGLYVSPDLVAFFRDRALPAADILVPNHFELEVLCNAPLPALADIVAAAGRLLEQGPRLIVVTSVDIGATAAAGIGNLLVGADGAWLVTTPRLPLAAKGCGDMLAALLLARLLDGEAPPAALAAAVSSVYAVAEATAAANAHELRLVEAQAALAAPPRRFVAEPVGR